MYLPILVNVHLDTEGNIVKKVSTPKGDLNNHCPCALYNITLLGAYCLQLK